MRQSSSRSRSRSKGNRRGGSRRSQERGGYKRSSRSDSRGRDSKRSGGADNQKRRNKFSDPSASNGGGNARAGFSNGFSDSGDGFRGGDRNFNGGNGGFGNKGGQFGSRNNDLGFKPEQNGGNSGFTYTNVRSHQGNDEKDKGFSHSHNDSSSFNRNQFDRGNNSGIGFNNNFQAGNQGAGGFDNYQISTSSLRQPSSKISRKVYIPQDGKFNYIGLIIGPKGSKQKQLEEMTSCKILIRGKGSQKQGAPPMPDDNEDLHVLIEADSEQNAIKAMREIENIIFMDDDQKVKMRDQQLKSNYNGGGSNNRQDGQGGNDRQTFIQVPNNVVGLIIGKKGDNIKQMREKSGADKVYMQPESQRNMQDDQFQILIVEGSQDSVEKVREMVDDIKMQQQQKKQGGGDFNNNRGGGNRQEAKIEMEIPPNLAGLVIGSKGSTLQQVGSETRTRCHIQQNNNDNRKILIIQGQTQEDCQKAKEIFEDKMNSRQAGNNNRGGDQRGGGHFNKGGNNNRQGGGGRPFNNRRPRKNADDDEIVDNANQYDYYPTYNVHEEMMQNQQMLVNMQQQYYQQPYQYPPVPQQPQDPQSSYIPQPPVGGDSHASENKPSVLPQEPQSNPSAGDQSSGAPQQQPPVDYPPAPYQQYPPQNFDQSQVQMQLQQYLQYQQMYMQNFQGPVIEEVLADGTVVSINSQQQDDKKKGKRGGRR